MFNKDDLLEKFHHFLHNLIAVAILVVKNLPVDAKQSGEENRESSSGAAKDNEADGEEGEAVVSARLWPVEHKEKIEYLKELVSREKANNDLIKKLKDEQAQALAEKEKEVQVRNDQIRKLDSDLKNVEKFSTDLIKRTKNEAEQSEAGEIKASEGKK